MDNKQVPNLPKSNNKVSYPPFTGETLNAVKIPSGFAELSDCARAAEVNPAHYRTHPSGIECIEVTEHYGFCIGNAIKYLWRAGLKVGCNETTVNAELRDLEKAKWYIDRHIRQLKKGDKDAETE